MMLAKKVRLSIFLTGLACLGLGCSKDHKSAPETIEGSYYSPRLQLSDTSYESEELFVFKKNGDIHIEIFSDPNSKAVSSKEVYEGHYSISGGKIKISSFKEIDTCADKSKSPLAVDANFKKDGENIVISDGAETMILFPVDSVRMKTYEAIQNCSSDQGQQSLNPTAQASPQTPTKTSTITLPPEIKPVTLSSPKGGGPDQQLPTLEVPREDLVKPIVDAAVVECLDAKECPAYVGLLIGRSTETKDGIQMYQCTTTYLGNGYFSTNSHCYFQDVPSGSRTYTSTCASNLWVKLPATGNFKDETFTCDKVVYLSRRFPINSMDPRYAGRESFDVMIFKVKESTSRPAAAVDFSSSVNLGDPLKGWAVNPVHSKPGIHGQVEAKTCTAYDPRGVLNYLKNDSDHSNDVYQNIFMHDCSKEMRKGNSGTTMFNKSGKGVMIFSTIYIKNESDSAASEGFGSKYSCIENVQDGDKVIFSGADANKCISFSNIDVDTIKANIETEKHNKSIAEINSVLEKIDAVSSRLNDLIDFRSHPPTVSVPGIGKADGSAFKNWAVVRTFGDISAPSPISYLPLNKFNVSQPGYRVNPDGSVLLNDCSQALSGCDFREIVPAQYHINKFSIEDIAVPTCIDNSKLPRRSTNAWWDWLGARNYDYDSVKVPIAIIATPYSLQPTSLMGPADIPQLHIEAGAPYTLKGTVILTLTPDGIGGYFTTVDLMGDLDAARAVNVLSDYFKGKVASSAGVYFNQNCPQQ